MNLQELDGMVSVVTGAAQGLGLGIARELAERGSKVLVADLQLEKAEAECEKLRFNDLDVVAIELDITNSEEVSDDELERKEKKEQTQQENKEKRQDAREEKREDKKAQKEELQNIWNGLEPLVY